MLTAQEAREESLYHIGRDDSKKLKEISEEIYRACREGKYFYSGKGKISRNLADGLRNLGYDVRIYPNETYDVIWDKYYE